MTSWQDNLTSNRERIIHIFTSGDISDVTFIVGKPSEQREFKLHKLILSLCSDVFHTMFYGSIPEANEVEVPDIEPLAFQIVVNYIYEESFLVSSMKEGMHTYFAADKYNIADLRNKCIAYINDNLFSENIPLLYDMPLIIEALNIKPKCKDIICKNTSKMLNSANFIHSPLHMVKEMMQMDNLNVESEEKLFEYLLKWAESTCDEKGIERTDKSLRRIMDPLLPHVQFLAMEVENFISVAGNSNILTNDEVGSIVRNFIAFGVCELPSWFNKEKSRNLWKSLMLYDDHTCYSYVYAATNKCRCKLIIRNGNIELKGITIICHSTSSAFPSALFYLETSNNGSLLWCRHKSENLYDCNTRVMKLVG